MQDGGREPADSAGPGPVMQWRLPLTDSVSYPPGRHGRASQTAAALNLETGTENCMLTLFVLSELPFSHLAED